MKRKPTRLGIISAVHQEQDGFIESMLQPQVFSYGMRNYVIGNLWGMDAVCVLSRMGKVAAATTAAILIEHFQVTHILFTGVAGAADNEVKIGDIVIAEHLIQHDMNAAPLYPRFEIPQTGIARLRPDRALTDRLFESANDFLEKDYYNAVGNSERTVFKLQMPRIHRGLIACGDEFIHSSVRISELKAMLPDMLAVEMEGAAVAQVCMELGIPVAVMRTVSDNANESSAIDFVRFIDRVASHYAFHIVKNLCRHMGEQTSDRSQSE